jgi:uncharacterized membrane protein YhhN
LRAEYLGTAWQVYLFKPLTTALILTVAAMAPGGAPLRYRRAVIAGLLFSLGGDIFLILPGDRFVAGLFAFLLAHLCYIYAFAGDRHKKQSLQYLLPFAIYFLGFNLVLWPHLGSLVLPVFVYGLALVAMSWQAVVRWAGRRTTPAAGVAVGGVLFVLSDSALAFNRFIVPYRASRVVIMTTYIAAQWLIAQSVREKVGKTQGQSPESPN